MVTEVDGFANEQERLRRRNAYNDASTIRWKFYEGVLGEVFTKPRYLVKGLEIYFSEDLKKSSNSSVVTLHYTGDDYVSVNVVNPRELDLARRLAQILEERLPIKFVELITHFQKQGSQDTNAR